MKCIHKERLILYFYGDCSPREKQTISLHISKCPHCAKEYAALGKMFVSKERQNVLLSEDEISSMIDNVRARLSEQSPFDRLLDALKGYFFIIKSMVIQKHRVVLVPVIAVFILCAGLFIHQKKAVQRDYSILEIELELSSDQQYGTIFDFIAGENVRMEDLL